MTHVNRNSDQMKIRFPEGWRSAIMEMAKRNRRSGNAQVVTMLEPAMKEELASNHTA